MKCNGCRFYTRSKVYGNGCSCIGTKPCETQRIMEKRKKLKNKRKQYINR